MIDLDVATLRKPNWQTKEGWADFVAERLDEPELLTRT